MLETKAGKIITLLLMIAVVIYTIYNYLIGKAQLLLLMFALFLLLTTGMRIVASLIDDFKKNKFFHPLRFGGDFFVFRCPPASGLRELLLPSPEP